MHVQFGGDGLVDGDQELLELHRAVLAVQFGDHRAVGDVERREQAGDAVAGVVVGAPFGHARHHRQHRLGPVQRLHLVFSSTHSTTAFSGGLWYRPTTSTTLSTNSGSVESLNPSTRCGLRSNRRQIRPIVDGDRPTRRHRRPRPVRRVRPASPPASPTTTSSTLSNRIDGGRPGRGSSTNPSRRLVDEPAPPLGHRVRHHPQVGGDLLVRRPGFGAGQDDPRPQRQRLRRLRPPRPPIQLVTLGAGQHQLSLRRPGRWPSNKPSTPAASNRLRHLSTVATVTPRSAATRACTAAGSANANTILARTARRDDPPRDRPTSRSRSSSVSSNSPAPDTAESIRPSYKLMMRDFRRDTLVCRARNSRHIFG